MLAPGYFAHGSGLLRPGDLMYVGIWPPATPAGTAPPGASHMALVMVRADQHDPGRPAGTARLVQDFGRPSDDPAPAHTGTPSDGVAPPAPAKHGRGRPPGSKNKKPGVRAATGGTLAATATARP